jgi:hypothetical protein
MAIKCEHCNQELRGDATCRMCKGSMKILQPKATTEDLKKLVDAGRIKKIYPSTEADAVMALASSLGVKYATVICPRCNGSGVELANRNRQNRSRGHGYERDIAKHLTEWWRKFDPTAEFQRTPSSGGSALKVGWDMAGDLTTNSKQFPLHLECKKQKNWALSDLLLEPKGGLREYVNQTFVDAPPKRVPALFLNNPGPSQPHFVMLVVTDYHLTCLMMHGVLEGPNRRRGVMVLERPFGLEGRVALVMQRSTLLATDPAAWAQTNTCACEKVY